jgi:type III secretion protein N (ATPase)
VRTCGATIVAALPAACVGDGVCVRSRGSRAIPGRVATIERGRAAIVPFESVCDVAVGDVVEVAPESLECVVGFGILGRGIDAFGRQLDDRGSPRGLRGRVAGEPPLPSERRPIVDAFVTGVGAIDGLLTIGRGARVGIFGLPGTGKSALLESIARAARADAIVVALVGERGREAQRWLERIERRTTVVVATADRAPAERIRAAEVALAHASYLRGRGLHVLFVVDSLARYAAALRERASALGEPAGRGGYAASVWSQFTRYVEGAGSAARGSITLLATVLADADDERDPVCGAARAALDGHIVLAPRLARAGKFPAIDVLASASRTMPAVIDDEHRSAASAVRETLALLEATFELRAAGLGDRESAPLARALQLEPALEDFLFQSEPSAFDATRRRLLELASGLRG